MGGGSVAVCSASAAARAGSPTVHPLWYTVALLPPQVYGTEFVLGASADEVVGCRELYRLPPGGLCRSVALPPRAAGLPDWIGAPYHHSCCLEPQPS